MPILTIETKEVGGYHPRPVVIIDSLEKLINKAGGMVKIVASESSNASCQRAERRVEASGTITFFLRRLINNPFSAKL